MKRPKYKIIEVWWYDPESIDPWESIADLKINDEPCYSVGMLLKENKNFILITLNFDPVNKNASCIMRIPKSCIRRRRWMKN